MIDGCPCCVDAYRCECGFMSNDPYHESWCKIWHWNEQAEAAGRAKDEAEFAKELQVHEARFGRDDTGPAQTGLAVGSGQSTAHVANPKARKGARR